MYRTPATCVVQTNCESAPARDAVAERYHKAFHTELGPRGFFLIDLPN